MSDVKDFSEVLKALATVTSITETNALVVDSSGELLKANASVLGMQLVKKAKDGPALAQVGLTLVIAVDTDEPDKVIIYTAYRLAGEKPVQRVIHSNGLSLGASNSQGTMTITGGTNIVQYALRLGIL